MTAPVVRVPGGNVTGCDDDDLSIDVAAELLRALGIDPSGGRFDTDLVAFDARAALGYWIHAAIQAGHQPVPAVTA